MLWTVCRPTISILHHRDPKQTSNGTEIKKQKAKNTHEEKVRNTRVSQQSHSGVGGGCLSLLGHWYLNTRSGASWSRIKSLPALLSFGISVTNLLGRLFLRFVLSDYCRNFGDLGRHEVQVLPWRVIQFVVSWKYTSVQSQLKDIERWFSQGYLCYTVNFSILLVL